MSVRLIACASCGRSWTMARPFSVYEQQALESCPCPRCGAYTLTCRALAEADRGLAVDGEGAGSPGKILSPRRAA